MRLMWQDDADADSTLESSERFYIMHDERWRPVATFRDADSTPKEAFVWHAAGGAGQGGFGGSSYIDAIILRDRDNFTGGTPNPMTSASDGTLEERRYFCQNWRADVVAVTRSDGTPIEYVRYSPYGEPTVYPVADLNMDGVVNSTDSSLWSDLLYSTSNSSVYADSDLDFDGLDDWNSGGADGDLFYESYTANLGLSGPSRVSSPAVASRTGYAGYQWDQTISANHVRYRVYLPDIGRWTRRDPLGYVDGQSLYSYVASRSLSLRDPSGLFPPLGSVPVVLLKSLDCEQRLDQSLELWRKSLGNAPDVLLSAISITAMQEYGSLSLTDRGAIGVFHTTQVCILGELHGCASASGSYSPADAQWIVDVTIAFMRPYLSSLCQRARGAPVFDPGWGDLWRRIDTGDLGTKLIPPTSREFEIARQAALNHINNDLSAALLKYGRGSNAVWACIGAAVDKCQKRTIGGMNLGADVAGACFERFDVGAIRDKMRDRLP